MMKKAAPESFRRKKKRQSVQAEVIKMAGVYFFGAIPACPITSNFDEGCSGGRFIAGAGAMHQPTHQPTTRREAGCSVSVGVGSPS
jgi:hypothetical protein